MGGVKVKKELIGERSVGRQLASDESPTVWIRDTPPVARPVRRQRGKKDSVSALWTVSGARRAHRIHRP